MLAELSVLAASPDHVSLRELVGSLMSTVFAYFPVGGQDGRAWGGGEEGGAGVIGWYCARL